MIHNCPVCSSENSEKLYQLNIDEIISEINLDSIKRKENLKAILMDMWQSELVSFLKCLDCGYGFSVPYISGSSQYYSQLYYNQFNYPEKKWEYEQTLHAIKGFKNLKHYNILELGAGHGFFLDLLTKNGFDKNNLYSTEYSESACNEINAKGFRSFRMSIAEIMQNKELPKFDCICMFQVLEHMDNIHEVFELFSYCTKDDANIFIAVPNEKLRGLFDKYKIHLDIPPTHVGKLPYETFQFLAKKYNWEIVLKNIEPASYLNKVKKFIFTQYWKMEKAQAAEKLQNRITTYLVRYFLLFSICIRYFVLILRLRKNELGTSFWIQLRKMSKKEIISL
jgi:2-polyprenyl-3-methyl-5-hydroxy-6-metoxy-1,4-benzoquinol methylase